MAISAKRVVVTSFLVDLLDVSSSVFIAIISGSVIMFAQMLEGLADLLASGLLILGVSRSSLAPDKDHPFGHGRELYFWTLISSLIMLGITASLSVWFGYHRFINPEPIKHLFWTYLILFITAFTNGYALFLSAKRLIGKERIKKISDLIKLFSDSPLIETRTTFVLDLMGTLASVLGLIMLVIYRITGDLRYDGLGAMIIGVTLGIFALILIISVKELLVGQSVSKKIKRNITQAVLEFKEVHKISDLRAVHTGPEQMFVNLDVNLVNNLTTDEIEKLITQIKQSIKKVEPTASQIQIELNS